MGSDITALLEEASAGSNAASEQLFQLVYSELRQIARIQRGKWVGDETLNTTALINEAYVKLNGTSDFANRSHFFATAAKAMRHILVNYAEKKKAGKRGGGESDLPLEDVLLPTDFAVDEALALHNALNLLEQEQPRWCRVFECRFFSGMNIAECAEALDISEATVSRDWTMVSAWLTDSLNTKTPE